MKVAMTSFWKNVMFLLSVSVGVMLFEADFVKADTDDNCMRQWLRMAGAGGGDLRTLEEKARTLHLSESQIRDVYPAPVLKALLPSSVAGKLKICTRNASLCGRPSPCDTGRCSYNSSINKHFCNCQSGLLGDFCQTDIDECSLGIHNCDIPQRALCNNTHGSFLCHCRHGYCGEDGQKCEDVDECEKGTHGCHSNATCANNIGSYQCSCVDGFEGDGRTCQEILCTEKNSGSKLCRQVESMRQQLSSVPRLEKKLEDLRGLFERTSQTIVFLSRALGEVRDSQNPEMKLDLEGSATIV